MQDYKDYQDDQEEQDNEDEQVTHYFCKLTFGQFFTLMVLEIITLSFVFYLGARYGNEYLKLDALTEAKREPISIVSEKMPKAISSQPTTEDAELKEMARNAIEGGKVDLKQRVEEILARQQGPTAPPMGEPAVNDQATYNQDLNQDIPPNIPPNIPTNIPNVAGGQNATGVPLAAPATENASIQEVVKVKSGDSKFSVQVGSYPDVKEASYRVEEWKAKGYSAYMMIVNLGDKGQWYRVRIGAFPDKDEAERYLGQIREKEGINDALVVRNEQ